MTFILSVLTGLGVGSGGLYILYLTLIKNIPQAEAQGMNFAFFISASIAAALVNVIKKRISFFAFFLLALTGTAGTALGASVANAISSKLLSAMFGAFLASIGIIGFFTVTARKK